MKKAADIHFQDIGGFSFFIHRFHAIRYHQSLAR